uniref:Uncharacterized protein n=1 Tax=Mus musculus TaxID=10090 RepID=Q3UWX4_MOUSE|nr:unnamed protein product [Mus musculus]
MNHYQIKKLSPILKIQLRYLESEVFFFFFLMVTSLLHYFIKAEQQELQKNRQSFFWDSFKL